MEEKTSTKKPFFSIRNIIRGILILLSVFVFCPSVLVSCSGEKIGTISAWQMIKGFELGGELIDAYPFFVLMLLIPIAIFVLSFIQKINKKTLGIITFAASLVDIILWIVFFVMIKAGVEEFSCECKPTFWYVINLVFQAASTAAGLLVMIGVLDMDGFAPTKQQFVNSVNNGYFDYGGACGQNSYGFGGPQQAGGTAYSADPFAGASAPAAPAPAAPAAPKIIGFCPRCGNQLRAGSAFCNACGNPLPPEIRAISEQAEREAEEQVRREAEERARREAEEQARREAEERARREAEEQARREEEERIRREAEEQARRAEEDQAAQAMRAVQEAQAARAAQAAQAAQAVQAASSTNDPFASRPMFCEACGAKLPPNAMFCERCGKKVM